MMNNPYRIQKTLLVISSLCIPILSHGEIIRDGTIGNHSSSTLSSTNNVYEILEEMGEKYGSNLLHSFEKFEILSGETAHFISDDSVIENIISRVTGADQSIIDGLLKSDKNFYLINPNGIIFGPNGSLDINGNFKVSTADSLIFDNGAIFAIDQPLDTALLSAASPSDFGFLNSNSGDVIFNGGTYDNANGDFIIDGNNINLLNGAYLGTANQGAFQLSALDTIALSGTDANGLASEILSYASTTLPSGAILLIADNITLSDNASITTTSVGSGTSGDITIDSNTLDLSNGSHIATTSSDVGTSGNISIESNESILISGAGTSIYSFSQTDGQSGNINVSDSKNIEINNDADIFTQSVGNGNSGNISIDNSDTILLTGNGSSISSSNNANGQSGNISISNSQDIDIKNGAYVLTRSDGLGNSGDIELNRNQSISLFGEEALIQSYTSTDGSSGNIDITDTSDFKISHGARITTQSDGDGTSGDVSITGGETITVGHRSNRTDTNVSSINTSTGQSGNITVDADIINLYDFSKINSTASTAGTSGDITINATDDVIMRAGEINTTSSEDATSGDITITAGDSISVLDIGFTAYSDDSKISSAANGSKKGGNITISSGNEFNLMEESTIESSAALDNNGGDISFANSNQFTNDGDIMSDNGGDITFTNMDEINSGAITSVNNGAGNGGDIIFTDIATLNDGNIVSDNINSGTGGNILLTNVNELNAEIKSTTSENGQGGNIVIEGGNIDINSNVTSQGFDSSQGGDIFISGDTVKINSSIQTESYQSGKTGNITLENISSLELGTAPTPANDFLRHEGSIKSISNGSSATGDITINAENFTMTQQGSGIEQRSNTETDNTGTITITGENLTMRAGATINNENQSNIGNISIDLSGGFIMEDFSDTSAGILTGGTLDIDANNISMADAAYIRVDDSNLTLNAQENFTMKSGANIESEAGDIVINAGNNAILTDEGRTTVLGYPTYIATSTVSDSKGGSISINASNIALKDDAVIETLTSYGSGDGGDITLNASNDISIEGTSLDSDDVPADRFINLKTTTGNNQGFNPAFTGVDDRYRQLPNNNDSTTSSDGTGNGGNISLNANSITLENGAAIETTTDSNGLGGSIDINAQESVLISGTNILDDSSLVKTTTAGPSDAGDISISSERIQIDNGAIIISNNIPEQISTPSIVNSLADNGTVGATGDITIQGTNQVTITGNNAASNTPTSIQTISDSSEDSGNILIVSDNINITDDARITSRTDGDGQGGNITVDADNINISDNALLSAKSTAEGNAGNITLQNADSITVNNSTIETSSTSTEGGNINLLASTETGVLVTRDSSITSSALGDGTGGNINASANIALLDGGEVFAKGGEAGGNINFDQVSITLLANDPTINADATFGQNGSIDLGDNVLEVDELNPEEQLATSFTDVSSLIRKSCSAYTPDSQFNVFNQTGVSASPESLLPSIDPIMTTRLAEINQNDDALLAQNQGAVTFRSGQLDSAKAHWTEAVAYYAEAGNSTGQGDALRGVAQVQQAQGEYNASIATLAQAVDIARRGDDQTRLAESLGSLGNALIAAGSPGAAEDMLTQAIEIAKDTRDRSLSARLNNNLGNYYTVNNKVNEALERYLLSVEASIETDQYAEATKAYANIARLNIYELEAAKALGALQQADTLIKAIDTTTDKTHLHIHLAKSYSLLADSKASYQSSLEKAFGHLQQAKSLSEQLGDKRLLSYALGNMGSLYQVENRPIEALNLTRQALSLAEETNSPESLYRWHWQEGQLLREQGKNQAAVDAYQRAITIIEDSRQTTLARYESADVHFKQQVQPVYKELADLLIQASVREDNDTFAQQLLLDTRDVMEQLKTAELENYFHDDCIATFETKRKDLDQVSPTAAVIYPIVLEDRLELLISLPDLANPYQRTLVRRASPVSATDITTHAQTFRRVAESINSTAAQHHQASQPFYNWLVRPYEEDLKKHNVDTLVFVPDGMLRTLPMSALHNGDNYLIEEYAVAITSSLGLTDPQPLAEKNNRVLLAGVSESVNGLPALEAVPSELGAVNDLFTSDVLLDDEFTAQAFTDQVKKENYSIIHIASHAQFTGDERNSFLQAYDQTLSMDKLKSSLNTTKYRDQPLEMLVLSACETASGDERSALGLAGVGIKAGARSAMGSLWSVSDDSAAELIEQFYTELHDNQLSKAHALRQAQLSLLEQDRYADPAHWSAFMIIDNWL